jgi:hypothetical protein
MNGFLSHVEIWGIFISSAFKPAYPHDPKGPVRFLPSLRDGYEMCVIRGKSLFVPLSAIHPQLFHSPYRSLT